MNPNQTVHELDRLLKEIRTYRDFKPEYYNRMLSMLHDMCILTLLEFSGPKANLKIKIDAVTELLHITKSTTKFIPTLQP